METREVWKNVSFHENLGSELGNQRGGREGKGVKKKRPGLPCFHGE